MAAYSTGRPNTVKTYAYWEDRFAAWLDGQSPSLEAAEQFLLHLRDEKGCKPNTIFVVAHAIRRNLGIPVSSPKMEIPEPDYLTLDQVNALIENSESILQRTLFTVLFDTACRISEVLQLRVSDLRLDDGVATMTRKGGRRQDVALGHRSVLALREWLKVRQRNDDRVFMDYEYFYVARLLRDVAKKLGFKFHPHLLRHTRIRQLLDSGVPLERASEIAGHIRLDTTMKLYGSLKAAERAKYLDEMAPW